MKIEVDTPIKLELIYDPDPPAGVALHDFSTAWTVFKAFHDVVPLASVTCNKVSNTVNCVYTAIDGRSFNETLHFNEDIVLLNAGTVGLWNIKTEIPLLRVARAWVVQSYVNFNLKSFEWLSSVE